MASSIGKNGVRNCSGPFDWVWTDLEYLMKCIDNDFSDFLVKDNINYDVHNATVFEDTLYKIQFFHDVKHNLETEYEEIYKKYMRRIERFREMIADKACFFRLVKDQKELKYISENVDDINLILKRKNEDNRIIYLIPKFLTGCLEGGDGPEPKIQYFYIGLYDYALYGIDGMSDVLSMNANLSSWLAANMNMERKQENLLHEAYRQAEINQRLPQSVYVDHINLLQHKFNNIAEKYNKILLIERTEFADSSKSKDIVIYGLGDVGKILYQKIKSRVAFFMDSYIEDKEYEGIKIYSPADNMSSLSNDMENRTIVVTPINEDDEINKMLNLCFKKTCNVISVDEFCMHKGIVLRQE